MTLLVWSDALGAGGGCPLYSLDAVWSSFICPLGRQRNHVQTNTYSS